MARHRRPRAGRLVPWLVLGGLVLVVLSLAADRPRLALAVAALDPVLPP